MFIFQFGYGCATPFLNNGPFDYVKVSENLRYLSTCLTIFKNGWMGQHGVNWAYDNPVNLSFLQWAPSCYVRCSTYFAFTISLLHIFRSNYDIRKKFAKKIMFEMACYIHCGKLVIAPAPPATRTHGGGSWDAVT